MRDKVILNLKIVAILFVLLMLVSCATPSIAVDNHSTNNASNQFGDIFPLENVTANNTPFLLSSNTYYVPDDYEKIQWAVDNATEGERIIVRDGMYTENLKVNKSLTIQSENGSANCIVQAANSGDHVFEITADYVNISGFTVKNANIYKAGINLNHVNHCKIFNNAALNNWAGIYLHGSSNNTITNNNASNNIASGINFGTGVYLSSSSNNNIITNNYALNNKKDGIYLWTLCNNNIITDNNVMHNKGCGIHLYGSCNSNDITNNTAFNNSYFGIHLWWSYYNSIIKNNILNNRRDGFYLDCSSNNNIYINNLINDDNIFSYNSTNIWNSTAPVTYIYNGSQYTSYLGNYWDDYSDVDANGDGIWDNPYSINGDQDYYPLKEGFENYVIAPEGLLDVPFFSQKDDRWKDRYLDYSPYNFSKYGCAVTSAAMVLNYSGWDTDPLRLNMSLTAIGGINNEGDITPKGWEFMGLKRVPEEGIGNEEELLKLAEEELAQKRPVMASVNTTKYPLHYIVFRGKVGDKYHFWDPVDKEPTDRVWPDGALGKYTLRTLRLLQEGPTCKIELQKDGVKIDKIEVGEWFNIVITDYSGDIKKVRFLSDESQNGKVDEGFTWTDWYDWNTSKEDWTGHWYASNKTKMWAFATPGEKEVWAEVEDCEGRTAYSYAGIYAEEKPQYSPILSIPVYAPTLQRVHKGINLSYIFKVANNGTVTDTIDLSVSDTLNWMIKLSEASVTLASGESTDVYLNVTIEENKIDKITITGTSQGDISKTSSCTVYADYMQDGYGLFAASLQFSNKDPEEHTLTFDVPDYVKISDKTITLNPSENRQVTVVFDPKLAESDLNSIYIDITDLARGESARIPIEFIPTDEIIATNYDMTKDSYSFQNWGIVLPILDFELTGHCYGMSETSILYFRNIIALPNNKPNTYSLTKDEAKWKITLHQWRWANIIAGGKIILADIDEEKEYNELEENIRNGKPMILATKRHAVLAYKIVKQGDKSYISIYNSEQPYCISTDSFYLAFPYATYNLTSHEFNYEGDTKFLVEEAKKLIFEQVILSVECPVNVTITDQYNRVISDTGINEILNATIISTNGTSIFYLPANLTYIVNVSAYDVGNFTLTKIAPITNEIAVINVFDNISITNKTKATLEIAPNETNQTMNIDYNGDGIIDEVKNPDVNETITVSSQENIFDTGKGTYPSISGNHTGTITPSCNISVSKLYTYPCAGTGGHTEYARIWNKTWNATATWEGYAGDWHNITFDKTVVLLENKTYTYTIRTGSYPQIIHEQNYTTLDGSLINCTEFTDVNGKSYNNWIPAIRLWS